MLTGYGITNGGRKHARKEDHEAETLEQIPDAYRKGTGKAEEISGSRYEAARFQIG